MSHTDPIAEAAAHWPEPERSHIEREIRQELANKRPLFSKRYTQEAPHRTVITVTADDGTLDGYTWSRELVI